MIWICANCQAESSKHFRCSRCNNVHYCNSACQRAHFAEHKPKCKEMAERSKQFDPMVDEAYQSWRQHNHGGLSYFAHILGGTEIGNDLVIAIQLEYKKENPIESRFQIVTYEKLSFDHPTAQLAISMAAEQQPLSIDKFAAILVVSCPSFCTGNGIRVTAIMQSEEGSTLSLSSAGETDTVKAAKMERLIQAINEGELTFSKKEQRLSAANFPWGDMEKYPAPKPNDADSFDPCGGRGCTKPGRHKCSSCKRISYCGTECQKAHWTHHKTDCKRMASLDARTAERGHTDKLPDGKVAFNMMSIMEETDEITAKADKVAKSFGLKNINEFLTFMAEAKKSGDYAPLRKLLNEKVGHARIVRFCYELTQLYDFEASVVPKMELRLWGNTHVNQLESTFRIILTPQEDMDKFVLYVQHPPNGITDHARRVRAYLLSRGIDLATLTHDQRPIQAALSMGRLPEPELTVRGKHAV